VLATGCGGEVSSPEDRVGNTDEALTGALKWWSSPFADPAPPRLEADRDRRLRLGLRADLRRPGQDLPLPAPAAAAPERDARGRNGAGVLGTCSAMYGL
jgi:hypothetical protein